MRKKRRLSLYVAFLGFLIIFGANQGFQLSFQSSVANTIESTSETQFIPVDRLGTDTVSLGKPTIIDRSEGDYSVADFDAKSQKPVALDPVSFNTSKVHSSVESDPLPHFKDTVRLGSPDYIETNPILGHDGISTIVVYTARPVDPYNDREREIYYQRLDGITPIGTPVCASLEDQNRDNLLNDISGKNLVYTSYDSTMSSLGYITYYNLSSGDTRIISEKSIEVREARVHGENVVWVEGQLGATCVWYYNLSWDATESPIQLTPRSPPVQRVEIGDQFIVWEAWDGTFDIYAYEISTGNRFTVANDPSLDERAPSTSGFWVAYQVRTWNDIFGIRITNPYTEETREVVAPGDLNRVQFVSIDGRNVIFETDYLGNYDIFYHDIKSRLTWPVTSGLYDEQLSDVFGSYIAYGRYQAEGGDIGISLFSNSPPNADAGEDQVIMDDISNPHVMLEGQGTDSDGDPITYSWKIAEKPAGSTAYIIDPSSSTPSISPDKSGVYAVELRVSDPWTSSEPDTVLISYLWEPHEPIYIDNDLDFGPTKYNFPGEGTEENPFLIWGYKFQSSQETLIHIQDTTVFFNISYCLLNGTSNFGIYLKNVLHGTVEDNNISNHAVSGIYITDSQKNFITNNTLHNNSNHGIKISQSNKNDFFFNEISNHTCGIDLYKSSSINVVSNTFYFNDWGIQDFDGELNFIHSNTLSKNTDGGIQLKHTQNTNYISFNRIEHSQIGIQALKVDQSHISLNNISYCDIGLRIQSSILSQNNEITYNRFTENNHGLNLGENSTLTSILWNIFDSNHYFAFNIDSKSINNRFTGNSFINNNNFATPQGDDQGENNHFSHNWWSDWTSPDSDLDGIVDTPYPIRVSFPENYDLFPLTSLPVYEGNTLVGSEVKVSLTDDINLEFSSVSESGETSLSTSLLNPGENQGFVFFGRFFELTTTAVYDGTITICIHYDDSEMNYFQESRLAILHWEDGQWVDVTTYHNILGNIICGEVSSFSWFGIASDPLIDHAPIHIFSNEEFHSQASLEGWTGTGNIDSPYVIKGYAIDAGFSTDPLLTTEAIRIENTDVYAIITGCELIADSGLFLRNTANIDVVNNTMSGCQSTGIYVSHAQGTITIFNNTATSNYNGITIHQSIPPNQVLISHNNCSDNLDSGLVLHDSSITILNNTFDRNFQRGMLLGLYSYENLVANNTFSNSYWAIEFSHSDNNIIETNEIFNCDYGIHVGGSGNTIQKNTFTDCTYYAIATTEFGGGFMGSNNRILYNDIIDSNNGLTQAIDDGYNNIYEYNYWNDWTSPDVNPPFGIVDNPYPIDGLASNNDPFPRTTPTGVPPSLQFIYIDKNEDFGPAKYDFPGEGTSEFPFLIDGYSFTSSAFELIHIQDTDVYFIIRNCELNGLTQTWDIISLRNVQNGHLEYNTITNGNWGIFVIDSYNCNITHNQLSYHNAGMILLSSSNNQITNNQIYSNNHNGLEVNSMSLDNNISHNLIFSNGGNGFLLFDGSDYNLVFNNTIYSNTLWGMFIGHVSSINVTENIVYGHESGIVLWNTHESNVTFNYVFDNIYEGIGLHEACSNVIEGNEVNTSNSGIILYEYCHYNNLSGNEIYHNTWEGIGLNIVNTYNRLIDNVLYMNGNGLVLRDKSSNNLIHSNTLYQNTYGGITIRDSSNYNTISENYVYENGWSGVYVRAADFNEIFNNEFINNEFSGISLALSSNNELYQNFISQNQQYGIWLRDSHLNTFVENTITETEGNGTFLLRSNDNILLLNLIELSYHFGIVINNSEGIILEENTIQYSGDSGIFIDPSLDISIINNEILFNSRHGIHVQYSETCTITDNNIFNNTEHGIFLEESHDSLVSYNTLFNNSMGVYLYYSSSNVISSNLVHNNSWGIFLEQSSYNSILHNRVAHHARDGIYLYFSSYSVINNTCWENNFGIYFYLSGSLCVNNTCTKNRWGIYFSDSAYCQVFNNTCNENEVGINMFSCVGSVIANNTCNRNDNGILLYHLVPTSSRESAVSNNTCNENTWAGIELSFSSDSEIINNLCIGNESSLKGIAVRHCINLNISHNIITNYTTGIYLYYSDVCVLSENTLVLTKESNPPGYTSYGFYADYAYESVITENYGFGFEYGCFTRGSPVTVDNNIFIENIIGIHAESTGIISNNFCDAFEYGIYLRGYASVINNTCSNNIIGIFAYWATSDALVDNNTCENNIYGIFVERSDSRSFSNNTCTNNDYGIYLFDTSCTIIQNYCADNFYGIYGNSVNSGVIRENSCPRNYYGIALDNCNSANIIDNFCIGDANSIRGISLEDSSSFIFNNTCAENNFGIYLDTSMSSVVANNTCQGNSDYGIYLEASGYSLVANNTCRSTYGIYLTSSDRCNITENSCFGNTYGINLLSSEYCNITNNTCETDDKGIYLQNSENSNLTNNKCFSTNYGVYLVDSSSPIIDSNICFDNIYGIYLDSSISATVLNNTCFENTVYGIYLHASYYSTVNENFCFDNGYGIYLFGSGCYMVANNTCVGNNDYGIILRFSSSTPLINNTCNENSYGIFLVVIGKPILANNTCLGNYNSGIHLESVTDAIVANNTCSDNTHYGIYLLNSDRVNISTNKILDNSEGIALFDSNKAIINENVIRNNGVITLSGSGILLDNSNSTFLMQNSLKGNYYGIRIFESISNELRRNQILFNLNHGLFMIRSNYSSIIRNRISFNGGDGIHIESSVGNIIHKNNIIVGNAGHGIYVNPSFDIQILNNTISENEYNGVFIVDSSNIRLEANNISFNLVYGILVVGTSENNYIFYNNFLGNNLGSCQASDSSSDTIFTQNYWDDHESSNYNFDKYYDTPYLIDGLATNSDELPLAFPTDQIIDSDEDGLIDPVELEIGFNPFNPDSDGDGLSDYYEVVLPDLNITTYFTDDCDTPINDFNVVFRKNGLEGFLLVATNPGQFFYHLNLTNTWDRPIVNLSVNLNLPDDFIFHGTNPIIVYLDGIEITTQSVIVGETISIVNIPQGSTLLIVTHLDYTLKGINYPSIDAYQLESYLFQPRVVATQELAINYYFDPFASLIGRQKKVTAIAGFVTDDDGNILAGVLVELYDENGNLVAVTTTDEDGFYYFIDLEIELYTVQINYNGQTYFQELITVKDELLWIDFILEN